MFFFTVGYLQCRDGCYIMERFFIKVDENIETHIAAEKETAFITLTEKKSCSFIQKCNKLQWWLKRNTNQFNPNYLGIYFIMMRKLPKSDSKNTSKRAVSSFSFSAYEAPSPLTLPVQKH